VKKQKNDVGILDEVMLKIPSVTIAGGKNVTILNYGGIIDYDEEFMSFSTSIGVIKLMGLNFQIKTITDEEITLEGEVSGMEIK